jgi:hypothetical protein
MKTPKSFITTLLVGAILTSQSFSSPGRFDDINVDNSPVEVGEVISVNQNQIKTDSLRSKISKLVEGQKQFIEVWSSKNIKTNGQILRYTIAAAIVDFEVAEVIDQVNTELGEEAFRAYTREIEEINRLLRVVEEQQQKIVEIGAGLKLKREKKFEKHKLLFQVPLN